MITPEREKRQKFASLASKEYLNKLEGLEHPECSENMFARQSIWLKQEKTDMERRKSEILALSKKTQSEEYDKLLTHIDDRLNAVDYAYSDITNNRSNVRNELVKEFAPTKRMLEEDAPALTNTGQAIKLGIEQADAGYYAKHFYEFSRKDTQARFRKLDAIYATGYEHVLSKEKWNARLKHLLLIPREIRSAQWKFMIALTDAAYNIFPDAPEGGAHKSLFHDIMADLFTRLSENERGKDNPHMGEPYKLRHNPAIHSLHICGLLDKMFYEVKKTIQRDKEGDPQQAEMLKYLKSLRNKLMLTAMVHDCGELEGEIAQAVRFSHLSEAERESREAYRGNIEQETFSAYLDKVLDRHKDRHAADVKAFKQQCLSAFETAERKDTFEGRFFKAAERMQSQMDFVRFNGLGGGKKLRNSTKENIIVSMNYVTNILFDADWSPDRPGPNWLKNLIEKDTVKGSVQKLLYAEIVQEFSHLDLQQAPAYLGNRSYRTLKKPIEKNHR